MILGQGRALVAGATSTLSPRSRLTTMREEMMSKTTKKGKGKDKKAKKVRQVGHYEPGLNAWIEEQLEANGGISFSAWSAQLFSRLRRGEQL